MSPVPAPSFTTVWTDTSLDLPQHSAEEIRAITTAAIQRANRRIDDAVAAGNDPAAAAGNDPAAAEPTFETLFGALDEAAREVVWASGHGAGRAQMTTDPAARAASFEAYEEIEKWRASIPLRPDLVQAIERFISRNDLAALAPDERALVERWRKDIRLAGGDLPAAERAEVGQLTARLVELSTAYLNNLATPRHFVVARADLDGVPDACVASLPPSLQPRNADFVLSYPNYLAVVEQGRNRELRERVHREWLRRGYPENVAILEEVLASRRRIAELLGYPSWQALRNEVLASPSAAWTNAFIAEMTARLRPIVAGEQAAMEALLRSEAGDPGLALEDWDWRYVEQRQRAGLGAGPEALMPYLELGSVLEGLAELSEDVFGLKLVAHPERTGWDPEVRPFDIVDAATGRVLAFLFMDPFTRDGKQAGAWVDVLLPGRPKDGLPPTLALVMNAPPVSDGPALLSVNEVETLFHEYGHAMNFAAGVGRFALHRESWLPFDFVEGPSSFVGSWGLEPQVMGRFARHHDTGAPIPAELMDGLRRAQVLNHAIAVQRQFWLARLDALLHGEEPISIDAAEAAAWPIRDLPFPEGTHVSANLTHIVSGSYHGALYGYAWSQLIRDDLLARFEDDGLTSPEVGRRYRATILDVGWEDDPVAAVNEFLGRPWSADAFLARAAEG